MDRVHGLWTAQRRLVHGSTVLHSGRRPRHAGARPSSCSGSRQPAMVGGKMERATRCMEDGEGAAHRWWSFGSGWRRSGYDED
jgi:hypothetical protein